jgi:hypothetical protein
MLRVEKREDALGLHKGNEYAYLLEVRDLAALGEEVMRGALATCARPTLPVRNDLSSTYP